AECHESGDQVHVRQHARSAWPWAHLGGSCGKPMGVPGGPRISAAAVLWQPVQPSTRNRATSSWSMGDGEHFPGRVGWRGAREEWALWRDSELQGAHLRRPTCCKASRACAGQVYTWKVLMGATSAVAGLE